MRRPLHAFRTFRGEEAPGAALPGATDPGAINDYRPKSMFEEYRGLVIVFAVLALALALYFIRSVLRAPKPAPPPVESVYIDTVPSQAVPSAPR